MDIKPVIISIIDQAVIGGKKIRVCTSDKFFTFYSDTCGQREATLKIRSYSIPAYHESDLGLGIYTINRVLSFTNKIDEGKNDAVLGEVSVNAAKIATIKQHKHGITISLDFIDIYIDK